MKYLISDTSGTLKEFEFDCVESAVDYVRINWYTFWCKIGIFTNDCVDIYEWRNNDYYIIGRVFLGTDRFERDYSACHE